VRRGARLVAKRQSTGPRSVLKMFAYALLGARNDGTNDAREVG